MGFNEYWWIFSVCTDNSLSILKLEKKIQICFSEHLDGPYVQTDTRHVCAEGDYCTISCHVDSNPTAHVWWVKEGNSTFNYDRNKVDFANITRGRSGNYICMAFSNRTADIGTVEVITANRSTYLDVQCEQRNI